MVYIFLFLTIAILLSHILSRKKYVDIVRPINKREYQLKGLLNIGLFILDLCKYKYNTIYDRKLLSKLGEIYGTPNASLYLRIHWANKITLVLIIIMLASLIGISIEGSQVIPDYLRLNENTILRPAFGMGNKRISLQATFKAGKEKKTEDLFLIIKELPPTDEEAVAAAKARLTNSLIQGKNTNLDKVNSSLNLVKEITDLGVTINWQSSHTQIINIAGKLLADGNSEEVILTATLSKGNVADTKIFKVTLMESITEIISPKNEAIKIIATQIDEGNDEAEIKLPTKLQQHDNVEITWSYPREEKSSLINLLLIIPIAIAVIVYSLYKDLNEKLRKRHFNIQMDFPDFLNKFILLINAGMNINRALEKIVLDAKRDSPLYNELRLTYGEIIGGKSELQAYEDFANRCKTPEITKFVSTLIQNLKKGDAEMIHILKLQSAECWNLRKSIAKQLGEEASTKLLFPMMIMFLAILLIILTPAVLTLSSM